MPHTHHERGGSSSSSSTASGTTTTTSTRLFLLRWLAALLPSLHSSQRFDLFTFELPDFQGMLISALQRVGVLPQRNGRARGLAASAASACRSPSSTTHCSSNAQHEHEEDTTAVRAWQEGALGFGFSAGGFLFAYHCGVVSALRQWGLLNASTPLAGVSAGSLVAALVKCDVPTEDIQRMYFECVEDLRSNGTAGRMREVLQAAMERHLPADAHVRCSGSLHVGVSHLFPFPTHTQVSQFETREALIEALLTSCHLPHYSSNDYTVMFQGRRAVDGGFTAIVPTLPESANAHTVKVCCLPASRVARLPFLNKKKAMHKVAIMPDHPRHYRQHCATPSSSSADGGDDASSTSARSAASCPAARRLATSTPQSPRLNKSAGGGQVERPACSMRRCWSASPFSSDATQQQQQPLQQAGELVGSATPGQTSELATVSSCASATPSSATPSSGCSLSRTSSHNGTSTSAAAGGKLSASRFAGALRRHLSSVADGGKASAALQQEQEAEQEQDSDAASSFHDSEGAEQEGESHSGEDAEDVEGDIVQEMVAWINVPAPDDEFYVRLMRKAERDTEAWVRASGLAAHLPEPTSSSSSSRPGTPTAAALAAMASAAAVEVMVGA